MSLNNYTPSFFRGAAGILLRIDPDEPTPSAGIIADVTPQAHIVALLWRWRWPAA